MWAKYTAFEIAHRSPMMIHVPGIIEQVIWTPWKMYGCRYLIINYQSMFSENLVEFVDILPTLVEASGLPELDKCPVDSRDIAICREGTSLLRISEGHKIIYSYWLKWSHEFQDMTGKKLSSISSQGTTIWVILLSSIKVLHYQGEFKGGRNWHW